MNVIILPGFSPKNKIWAEQTKAGLSELGIVSYVEWDHWATGGVVEDFLEVETNKIIKKISSPVNIIAKSIGTLIATKVIDKKPKNINKLILCGIPINDLDLTDISSYNSLAKLNHNQIVCIQNENDSHGTFKQVLSLVSAINQNIEIISKPRSDHEYPYADDFLKFINS